MKRIITITYCRWFQKSYGNSLFALFVNLTDYEKHEEKSFITKSVRYGYGTYPHYYAIEQLRRLGYNVENEEYIKDKDTGNYTMFIKINGEYYEIIETDMDYLPRKKDCKNWIDVCKRQFPKYTAI